MSVRLDKLRRGRRAVVSGQALGRVRRRTFACGSCGAVMGDIRGVIRATCPICQGELIKFDSIAEARRWDALVQEQRRGRIHDLRRQIPFTLVEGRYTDDGRAIRYVADFTYYRPAQDPQRLPTLVIEDVKGGAMTALARLKLALLRQRYGGDNVEIIISGGGGKPCAP